MKGWTGFLLIELTVLLAFVPNARAEVVAEFRFEGNDYTPNPNNVIGGNQTLFFESMAGPLTGINVSSLQTSPGLDPTATLGFAANDYDNALGFSTDVNADRNLATTDQTVFFNVDIEAGFQLSLESLEFDSLKTRGANATGSRVTHAIFVNPDGDPSVEGLAGDFDFLLLRNHDHTAAGQGGESIGDAFSTGRWAAGPIDLSPFQDLTDTATIAIRMNSSDGSDRDFGIDNLILRGTVTAVPEPAMVGPFALAGLWFWRRKRITTGQTA